MYLLGSYFKSQDIGDIAILRNEIYKNIWIYSQLIFLYFEQFLYKEIKTTFWHTKQKFILLTLMILLLFKIKQRLYSTVITIHTFHVDSTYK